MPGVSACPDVARYRQLASGSLPPEEKESLLRHLEGCDSCAHKVEALPNQDTLVELLRQGGTRHDAATGEKIARLVDRLSQLRPALQGPAGDDRTQPQGPPSAALVPCACTACGKRLMVKDGQAGKKVKCPGCGQVFAVPVPAAPPAAPSITQQPTPAASGAAASSRFSHLDATIDSKAPGDEHEPSATDFLSPPQAPDELGRLGKYRILQVLGQGGMGVVFKAEDPLLKRAVAVKAMLPALAASASAGKRFIREAQAMAAVEHDHVVRVLEVAEERGVPFLAMEFLKGEPLDVRLEREGRLPVLEVLRIGKEIAEGLAAAHERGLIHRDIKPANIWLEGHRRRVKILDFGLARSVAQDAGLTQQGAILGTPAYMAPEQARGDAVDGRADLFSLGVLLYRLCCGQPAFLGKDTVSTLMAVATQEPPPPVQVNPELPTELSDLIVQLLQKEAVKRPQSAAVVVEVLHGLEKQLQCEQEPDQTTVALRPTSKGRAAPTQKSRLPLLVGVAGLLLALVGVVLWASGVFRVQTEQGDLVFVSDDPDFAFVPVKGGGVTLEDRKSKRTYQIKAVPVGKDDYELEITDAGAELSFKSKTFQVKRGKTVALKAWFERRGGVAGGPPPLEEAWLREVASLPAEKQVEAVAIKLKERNPGFDRAPKPTIENGVVTGLEVHDGADKTPVPSDLSPLRALTGLETLICNNEYAAGPRSLLTDLSSLRGLKLKTLSLRDTRVADLTPLQGMPLKRLFLEGTRVVDLAPLKSLPLEVLELWRTPVFDLSALKGMHLTRLSVGARVQDLTPLREMKTLTSLGLQSSAVTDLSPLKGLALTTLNCMGTKVTDLSPVKDAPLVDIGFDVRPERDAALLRSIKTLRFINHKPAAEFWKEIDARPSPIPEAWFKEVARLSPEKQVEAVAARLKERNPGFDGKIRDVSIQEGVVSALHIDADQVADVTPLRALTGLRVFDFFSHDAGKCPFSDLSQVAAMKQLTSLTCAWMSVSDLTPLKALKLTYLNCGGTRVSDLSPLKGMPLVALCIHGNPVSDLSPLKGMKLESLICGDTPVADLSPLAGMPLTKLVCVGTKVTDLSPLKGMPLKEIECDFVAKRDAEILRSIKTLETINKKPAAEFWKTLNNK